MTAPVVGIQSARVDLRMVFGEARTFTFGWSDLPAGTWSLLVLPHDEDPFTITASTAGEVLTVPFTAEQTGQLDALSRWKLKDGTRTWLQGQFVADRGATDGDDDAAVTVTVADEPTVTVTVASAGGLDETEVQALIDAAIADLPPNDDGLLKASNLSDLPSASTARTNLGLGTSATRGVGTSAGTVAAGDDSRFAALAAADTALDARVDALEAAPAFDPMGFGISWQYCGWAENPAWTPPADFDGVSSLPDMGGGSYTLSQATDADRPGYIASSATLGGKPAIGGPGRLATVGFWTTLPQPYSIVLIGQVVHPLGTAVGFDSSSAGTRSIVWQSSNQIGGFATTSLLLAGQRWLPGAYRFRGNGTSSQFAVATGATGAGTVSNSGAAGSNSIVQPLYWGNVASGTITTFGNFGPVAFVGIYAGDISTLPGWLDFLEAATEHYQLNATRNVIVCGGDSRTFGTGITHGNQWPARLDGILDQPASLVNIGVESQTLATANGLATALINGMYDATQRSNTAICTYGINDIFAGTTAAALYALVTTWVNARKATGFQTVVCTLPPAATVTGTPETHRVAFNALVLANACGAEGVVDLAADSRLSNTANATYYNVDGVHYTNTGSGVWAELIKAGLASLPTPVS